MAIAYSNDGKLLATSEGYGGVKLWEIKSGALLRALVLQQADRPYFAFLTFNRDDSLIVASLASGASQSWDTMSGAPIANSPNGLELDVRKHVAQLETGTGLRYAISPDNRYAAVARDTSGIEIWDLGRNVLVKKFGRPNFISNNYATPLGEGTILQISGHSALTWNTQTGALQHVKKIECCAVALSRDGSRTLIEPLGGKRPELHVVDPVNPAPITRLDKTSVETSLFLPLAISDNGKSVIAASNDNIATVFDTISGKRNASFKTGFEHITAISFSPDGTLVAISGSFGIISEVPAVIEIRNTDTGNLLRIIKGEGVGYRAVKFSPDGRLLVAMGWRTNVFNMNDGKGRWSADTFATSSVVGNSISISPDGRLALFSTDEGSVELRSLNDGALLAQTETNEGYVFTAFTADSKAFVTTGSEGVMKIWNLRGQKIATFHAGEGWVTMTPAGFFASDNTSPASLKIVRGMHAYDISQVYQALYRPDLVEANLTGDRFGKYLQSSSKLNLRSLLDTGPPPLIRILDTQVSGTEIQVEAEAADQGGGIGKIEWRLNGRTINVEGRGMQIVDANEPRSIKQNLSLAPGIRNVISITGYNSQGLVASTPLELVIDAAGTTTEPRGSLYVLAIGVDKYADASLTLRDATSDAKAIGQALSAVGSGIYNQVKVTTLLDGDVSAPNIDTTFRNLALQIKPEDKFVFFIAGHGLTRDGKYYFLPQDFGELDTYLTKGIDQDKWQEWFASIKARSSVLLYDTCESGTIARDVTSEKSAAMDRLSQAVGINVIAASDADRPLKRAIKGTAYSLGQSSTAWRMEMKITTSS